jgi:hypothetical protein
MRTKHSFRFFAGLFFVLLLAGCKKEEDMVVDRVAAPVLVTIKGTAFTASEAVSVQAGFYELDKRGLLNHAVGIDSIPVANLAIKVRANNRDLADFTTDSQGKIILVKSWADFGLMSPMAGNVVNLEWSGSYNGQSFTRLSRVQVR